ncbi:MAG: division/cell wall cluster transcriptional repressor MraZ [Propionibacteriaceae bacterium]|nr:division/cell wall cluster transcriptional repressor MraZ [Propionibacteriaceae bacterium]
MDFFGTFTPKLDDKGRLFLPAKFRDAMAGGCVATLGFERTIAIYPRAAFDQMNKAVSALPLTVARNRHFARMFRANAHEQTPDKQGRIVLPQHLRDYARLDRELVVNGGGHLLEVWNLEQWEQYCLAAQESYAEMNDEMFPSDFFASHEVFG